MKRPPGFSWWVAALAAALAAVALFGCFAIPVRAVPSDEPILVATVGTSEGTTGTTHHNPNLPQPDPAKFPPAASTSAGWGTLGQLAMAALGIAGTGGAAWALRLRGVVGTLRTAVGQAAAHADRIEDAVTGADGLSDDVRIAVEHAVADVKRTSAIEQDAAGVRAVIAKARRKPVR